MILQAYVIWGIFYLVITGLGLLVARDMCGPPYTTWWARALLATPVWPVAVVIYIGYLLLCVIEMAGSTQKR